MRRTLVMMSNITNNTSKRFFAPLKEPFSAGSSQLRKLEGVVFDMDGTLCEPQTYMFHQMRTSLSIPKTVDILEHIYALPTPAAQIAAMESIRSIEREAMASQVAQPGLVTLMTYLDSRGVRKGICTRNFDAPVRNLLEKFLSGSVFHPIVTREFRPPKPDPAGILHIAKAWGLVRRAGRGESGIPEEKEEEHEGAEAGEKNGASTEEGLKKTEEGELVADASGLIMVGDSIDDMTAGRRAGAKTVLLVNDVNRHLVDHEHTDLVIERLDQLVEVLEEGLL
ncbi:HAD-like domain-containing protein [Pseudoneurospora amorphoporcata]|uniref:HAD-like domain-containing protein n=1 Tax=Pseudoneurospora amorphoporcata TaxID=241081 RepID=A0AAN6SHL2_9PEZI|nr:HAD-like domain-containing protein [Pseudoneurospora amorphoporcata]